MSIDSLITVESLLYDISAVPSLPLLYTRLDETINHPRSSISDIAKVLSEDHGLTGRILKLANSPLFGYFSKIDTITQAVTIIGIQQVRDLALAISVIGLFKDLPEDLIVMEEFWKHSISTALSARVLATSQREPNLERFFVAGILHDIGKLVLYCRIPDICRGIIATAKCEQRSLFEIEKEQLGFNHAEVGGALLRSWKLPSRVVEPVEYHHSCNSAGQFPRESAILHCADLLSHAIIPESGNDVLPPLISGSWERLAISPFQLSGIISLIDSQYEEISSTLFGDRS